MEGQPMIEQRHIDRAKELIREKMLAKNDPGITAIVETFGFADDDPAVLTIAKVIAEKEGPVPPRPAPRPAFTGAGGPSFKPSRNGKK